jgi:hypothetical protein
VGKFYTADYAMNDQQSNATSSLAFTTLSGQINNMLSQWIDSNNWNIGANLSTGDKGWSDVEAEAVLSGRLLNNRLIVNGNFGYKDNAMLNSNFAGRRHPPARLQPDQRPLPLQIHPHHPRCGHQLQEGFRFVDRPLLPLSAQEKANRAGKRIKNVKIQCNR